MIKSKLIQLLKSLSPAEVKEFGRYLEGTSYRKGGALFTLFDYLKKQHPEFPDAKIEKELVHKKTRKDKKPIGRRFFDLVSMLNNEVEEFLVQKKLKETPVERELLLLRVLRERRMDKMFFQKASLLEKNWDKISEPGTQSLYHKYNLLDCLTTHPQFARFDFDIQAKQKDLLQTLDDFYVSAKMVNVMSAATHDDFAKESEQSNFVDKHFLLANILKGIEDEKLKPTPLAEIASRFVKATLTEDFRDYEEVKRLFQENFDGFSVREKVDLFVTLEIYCIKNHYSRKEGFIRETFELYSMAREMGILVEEGVIVRTQFLNVVNVGQFSGEIEWTKSFIAENAPFLKADIREDIVALCTAKLLFQEKKYEEILSILATAQFNEVVFGVEARVITIQSYFMLGEAYDDLLDNLLHSFKIFLGRREDIPQTIVSNTTNFLQFIGKLHKWRYEINKENQLVDRTDIESCTALYGKQWLLSQFDEIQKK